LEKLEWRTSCTKRKHHCSFHERWKATADPIKKWEECKAVRLTLLRSSPLPGLFASLPSQHLTAVSYQEPANTYSKEEAFRTQHPPLAKRYKIIVY